MLYEKFFRHENFFSNINFFQKLTNVMFTSYRGHGTPAAYALVLYQQKAIAYD